MRDRESNARSRELGVELRKLRQRTGCSALEFARIVGWSNSKVSRIETGLRGITDVDVVRYAVYCRATPGEVDDLVSRCREAEVPGLWLSRRLSTLVFHESSASSSVSYGPLVVPELLQTERYARALVSREAGDERDIGGLIEARMSRQEVLGRRQFTFFVHEQALRFPVGDGRLMNEQMLKLLLLAEHPWIGVRVVPLAAGVGGALGSEFELLRFDGARPLIHLGHCGVSLFVEDASLVAAYQEHVVAIADVALDRGQSREALAAVAAEFDVSENPLDAQAAEGKPQ